MRKPLKLGFVDYFTGMDEFFIEALSKSFDITRDDTNPDYLIFCDETFGMNNTSYDMNKVRKIFYTGENRRAENYKCHFAITFDHHDTPTHFRLPLYVIDHWIMVRKLGMPPIHEVVRNRSDLASKSGFCGFVSGNGVCPERNAVFQALHGYKPVDSAGPLFNNVPIIPRGVEAAKHKNDFLVKYKFNLCFENSAWPGYCTEKLFHAFYMKTIPIYWGSPTAAMDFNPKAFFNYHDYGTFEDMLNHVVRVDNDPHAYMDMYMQPIFNPDRQAMHINSNKYMNTDRLVSWFERNVYKA